MDISRVAEQLLDSQEGQMPLGKPRSRWKYIIKWISDEIRCVWLRIGPVEASCEHGNEAIVFHKMAEMFQVAGR
jgi:hypothetical protein